MYFSLHGKVVVDASGLRSARYREYLGEYWKAFAVTSLPAGGAPLIELGEEDGLAPAPGDHRFGQFYHGGERLLYRSDFAPFKRIAISLGADRCRIVLEPGVSEDELYTFLGFATRQLAIASGCAFLHSSGVVYQGVAHVFPAWGGIGKSSLLMNLLRRGGQYLGDDLLLVDAQGVYAYPMPLNLLHYNLSDHWDLLAPVSKPRALRYHRLLRGLRALKGPWAEGTSLPARVLRKVETIASGRSQQHLEAERIFTAKAKAPLKRFDECRVYYMERRVGDGIEERPLDAERYARKMKHCLRWERSYFGDLVTAFLYAFPERELEWNALYEKEREIICKFFSGAKEPLSLSIGDRVSPTQLAERISGRL